MDIDKWLKANAETSYKQFSSKIVKTKYAINGVRMGKLRTLAKDLVKQEGIEALKLLDDSCYEKILLQGLVIAYSKVKIEDKVDFIYHYLLKVDDWSLTDSFVSTFKLKKDELKTFYDLIQNWQEDEHEYVRRFYLVFALGNYLKDEYVDEVLDYCKKLLNETYMVEMANAWLLATAYINYPLKVLEVVKYLDDNTYRYTKGKIRDSYRISKEEKERFYQWARN